MGQRAVEAILLGKDMTDQQLRALSRSVAESVADLLIQRP
jgi:hypothetical protein